MAGLSSSRGARCYGALADEAALQPRNPAGPLAIDTNPFPVAQNRPQAPVGVTGMSPEESAQLSCEHFVHFLSSARRTHRQRPARRARSTENRKRPTLLNTQAPSLVAHRGVRRRNLCGGAKCSNPKPIRRSFTGAACSVRPQALLPPEAEKVERSRRPGGNAPSTPPLPLLAVRAFGPPRQARSRW